MTTVASEVPATTLASPGRAQRRYTLARRYRAPIWSAALLIAILGAWQALVSWLDVSSLVVPSPMEVGSALLVAIGSKGFAFHFAITAYEVMLGFLGGSVIGLVLGGLIGQSLLVEKVLLPYLVSFQSIPKVAIAPLIVIWFGFDTLSKVVVTAR